MNPRERWLACMRGEPVDRVPLHLLGLHYPTREALRREPDPRRRELGERIFDQTHYQQSTPSQLNRYLVTPPQRIRLVQTEREGDNLIETHEIDTPRGALVCRTGRNQVSHTTWQLKYPVESLEDIEKIRSVPWELPTGLVEPEPTEWSDNFARRGIRHAAVSSPFVCVAGMMSYELFLELCLTELDLLKELSAICQQRTLDVLDVLLAPKRIEMIWMGGCEWVTPPMASPQVYEELVQNFETPIIERIHAGGALAHVHCHGKIRSTLDGVIARGADYFEPVEPPPDGDITFAEAKARADGRLTLGGNVEARILEYGSADEVETATRAAFAGGTARMVLQDSAGPIAALTDTMLRNYHRLIDVWEECSSINSPVPVESATA